jgi:CHAT domain-containing protein/Flp pilus assembly protein TadD
MSGEVIRRLLQISANTDRLLLTSIFKRARDLRRFLHLMRPGFISLLALSLLTPALAAQNDKDISTLEFNKPIERELAGGQSHSYRIVLAAGQYLHVIADQRGIDVVVTLFAPDGKQVVEVDSPNGTPGPEPVSVIVETTGTYRLEVRSLEKDTPAGRYAVKIEELRLGTVQDKNRISAQQAVLEAELLREQQTAESRQRAITKYEAALPLYRAIGDRGGAAKVLNSIGLLYNELGETLKARDYYKQAVPEFQAAGNRRAVAVALNNIGRTYNDLGEKREALDYYIKALSGFRVIEDSNGQATLLINVGDVYSSLDEKQTALDYYLLALPIIRALRDPRREEDLLNKLGVAYYSLGKTQKALDTYEQALALNHQSKDPYNQAITINNLAMVYDNLGDKQKALDFYTQALAILRTLKGQDYEIAAALNNIGRTYNDLGERQKALDSYKEALSGFRAAKNQYGEGIVLTNIGEVYYLLGERELALSYFSQALPIRRAVQDRGGEATTLTGMGVVYESLGEKPEALRHFIQARAIYHDIGNRLGEAQVFNNLGLLYKHSGERQKALEYYLQALPLFRAVGSRIGEATVLSNIGGAYDDLGDVQRAIAYYIQALPILRAVRTLNSEAVTLNNLMLAYRSLKNQRLAIFYGKQSVNAYQLLRSNIQDLEKDVQKTYLRSVETTYRGLAELLVMQGRLAEAQQVLNAFKDQQYFDFDQTQVRPLVPLVRTLREAEYVMRYEQASDTLGAIGGEVAGLKLKLTDRRPTDEEARRLQQLEAQLTTASAEFSSLLKQSETEFSKPADEKDKVGEVPDTTQMQAMLRQLRKDTGQNAVAVYTLFGETKFYAVIVTANDITSVSSAISGEELNKKARDLWGLLQSDAYDPTTLSNDLYNAIFKPIGDKLPKDTKTILWSLDGNLRYVPMAALYDGRRYLIERYNHVNFTRADRERMTRTVTRRWTATGLGTSAAHKVNLRGEQIPLEALPGVSEELRLLFRRKDNPRGIFSGETLQDAKFTKPAMLSALRQRRPLVHIASHFAFRPGDEEHSFLLMGDGTAFTLAEMKQQERLFDGVELLTLSACNTAAQQAGANGREIDAFAELAQRLGANAVMATLWPVADSSTPWLMRKFYLIRQNRALNKAEALRQAQLALLNGKAEAKPSPAAQKRLPKIQVLADEVSKQTSDSTRADLVFVDAKNAVPFTKDPSKPFAHPYYWSPFILIGNWQ